MTKAKPSVHIVSLGCAKNHVDSEVILGSALARGHRICGRVEEADVIVVNTCGFIEEAKRESIDTILALARHKTEGKAKKLIVTGCLTQRYPNELAREIPEIDHIFGSSEVERVAAALDDFAGARVEVSENPHYLYNARTVRELSGAGYSAYVKIAEGCDRPCAFCIIPKLRGQQRSRSIDDVEQEVRALAARGVREINLVAQDLTAYGTDHPDAPTLAGLLRRLGEIKDVVWVRLHYAYPTGFSEELIETIAGVANVAKYIDVPVQHIDDDVLKIMRRGYGSRAVHELVERLRRAMPGVVLRTTLIAGHPGETRLAFDRLAKFVQAGAWDHMGVFAYSDEEGTPAFDVAEKVGAEEALARRDELMELQRQVSRRRLGAWVGRELSVLVEGVSEESEYLLDGRHYGQAPGVDGLVYLADAEAGVTPGSLLRARVTDASDYDLAATTLGVLAASPASPRRLPVMTA